MLERHGCVKVDLMGEIRSRAGRNSVSVDKDVKDTDAVSPGTESTDMNSHHVFWRFHFVTKNQGAEYKHPIGNSPWTFLTSAQ